MKTCIEECKRDEANFIKSLSEEFNNLGVFKRRRLQRELSVPFTSLELDARRSIKKCVESYGAEVSWFLSKRDKSCIGKELEFFSNTLYQNCPFKWRSQHDRVQFYHQCLEKFPIDAVHDLAKKQVQKFEQFAFALKKSNRDRGNMDVGSGSAMIAGKLLNI